MYRSSYSGYGGYGGYGDYNYSSTRRVSASYERSSSPARGRSTHTSYDPYRSTSYSNIYTYRAASPARDTTYTSYRAASPLRSITYYRAASPVHSSSYNRAHTPPPATSTSYYNTATPNYNSYSYTSRARTPPARAYSPPRSYSPITTCPTRTSYRSPSPARYRSYNRSPSRHRSYNRSRSRLADTFRRAASTVRSALESVPREDLQDFGTALGGYMADRLGWSGVDGSTTGQREGRDRWRDGESYWGYSTMG